MKGNQKPPFFQLLRHYPKQAFKFLWAVLKESEGLIALLVIGTALLIFDAVYAAYTLSSHVILSCTNLLITVSVLFPVNVVVVIGSIILYYAKRIDKTEIMPEEFEMKVKSAIEEDDIIDNIKLKKGCCNFVSFCFPIFIILLVLSTAFNAFIFGVFMHFRAGSLPQVDGAIAGLGLKSSVTVQRDSVGVVHIVADNELDLFFAQGYVTAQERLFQIDLGRRAAQGRLAEILGVPALPIDIFFRTLGIYNSAIQDSSNTLSNRTYGIVDAYVKGINAYIETGQKPTELELLRVFPEPWNRSDVLASSKLLSLDLSKNFRDESGRYSMLFNKSMDPSRIEEILPFYPTDGPFVVTWTLPGNVTSRLPEFTRLRALIPTLKNVSTSKRDMEEELSGEFSTGNPFEKAREAATRDFDWEAKNFLQELSERHGMKIPSKIPTASSYFDSVSQLFRENLARNLHENFLTSPGNFFGKSKARASNNWVIHGNLTSTGKPLLANDPHLDVTTPSLWLAVHLESRDPTTPLELLGVSYPGTPGILIGRNHHIAWGCTNTGADVQDLFIVNGLNRTNPFDLDYFYNGTNVNATLRLEQIFVSGDDVATLLPVRDTLLGPVLTDGFPSVGPFALALQWTSLQPGDTTLDAFVNLYSARNFTEFRNALKLYNSPSQNFVYADVEGNIGYQAPGKMPIRSADVTGMYPVDSNTTEGWTKFFDFDQLPFILNPPEGFVVSANNQINPPGVEPEILGGSDWTPPYRAARIRELIQSLAAKNSKISSKDIEIMQADVKSLAFFDFKKAFEIMRNVNLSPQAQIWRDRLILWDGETSPGKIEPTMFWLFYSQLAQVDFLESGEFFLDSPTYLSNLINKGNFSENSFSNQFLCGFVVQFLNITNELNPCLRISEFTLNEVSKNFSSVEKIPNWGNFHATKFAHRVFSGSFLECLFDRTDTQKGGDTFTINVAEIKFGSNLATHVPSYRQIIDFSDVGPTGEWTGANTEMIHGPGQSGNLFSEDFDSYLSKWGANQYVPFQSRNFQVKSQLELQP